MNLEKIMLIEKFFILRIHVSFQFNLKKFDLQNFFINL